MSQILQKRVALAQHAIVILSRSPVRRTALGQEIVEEPPAIAGITAHEHQIFRGEQHNPDVTDRILYTGLFTSIHASTVALLAVEAQLDAPPPSPFVDIRSKECLGGSDAQQRSIVRDTMAAADGEIVDSLQEVRLAMTVGARHEMCPRTELHERLLIVAPAKELQPLQMHLSSPKPLAASRRVSYSRTGISR